MAEDPENLKPVVPPFKTALMSPQQKKSRRR
jgi:hypothetical protein